MPREPDRQGIVKRLAIRATLDALPTLSRRELAALFHASTTQVQQAASHTVAEWCARLTVARDHTRILSPLRQARAISPVPQPVSTQRPGDRSKVRLEIPEATIVILEPKDFDVPEPVIDYDAIDRATNEALDDYDDQVRMTPEAYATKMRKDSI